ncbi:MULTISPECIES: hypothetical protein [unclassified Saccharicrinis]|uniref:hypothetical protein n=1 Tax=unclassified Saccharicrinis TaxID=2646859 RepID=UPI003D32847E
MRVKYSCQILLLGLFIIGGSILRAQTKREVQFSLDTLMRTHKTLQQDLKVMKLAWKKQNTFFEHVKSAYFDPADVNTSIDDGVSKFDEMYKFSLKEMEVLRDSIQGINDSLNKCLGQSELLDSQNKAYKELLLSSINPASFPQSEAEFIGEWDLFLHPVQLTGEPFESGIVSFNPFVQDDSLTVHNVYKIEFAEDEIATLYFRGGNVQKSFYSVKNFSMNSPYVIKFSKNEEFKLAILVSPIPTGLMVSYEVPLKSEKVYYYHGLMKK